MGGHRLLVTGLRGFVGSALAAEARASADFEVHGLVDATGKSIDIRDEAAVDDAVEALRPTAIVHLAAIASPRDAASEPAGAWAVNLMGTFNLANALLRHVPEARFVFAGSSEAYGASFAKADEPLREDAPFEPMSVYGATKASADIMLGQMARQGLRATRFRPFNHTGAGQTQAYVVSAFARQIVRIERGWQDPVMAVGNLDAKRDFLDVRDIVAAYLLAASNDADTATGAFNLSTGSPVAIDTILQTLVNASTVSIEIRQDPALMRPSEVPVVSGDPSASEAQLGWRRRFQLEETLDAVLEGWRRAADETPEKLKS